MRQTEYFTALDKNGCRHLGAIWQQVSISSSNAGSLAFTPFGFEAEPPVNRNLSCGLLSHAFAALTALAAVGLQHFYYYPNWLQSLKISLTADVYSNKAAGRDWESLPTASVK